MQKSPQHHSLLPRPERGKKSPLKGILLREQVAVDYPYPMSMLNAHNLLLSTLSTVSDNKSSSLQTTVLHFTEFGGVYMSTNASTTYIMSNNANIWCNQDLDRRIVQYTCRTKCM